MLYVDTFREGATPFNRFVSLADIKDIVDISEPRKLIDISIMKLLKMIGKDQTVPFLPVIGEAGVGKTHLYWDWNGSTYHQIFLEKWGIAAYYAIIRLKQALSNGIINHACLIVPRETSGKKFLMTCNEMGSKIILVELNEEEAINLIKNAKTKPSIKRREFARLIFKDLPLEPPSLETEEHNDQED